jgi:CheY-like chemotaxis protein
MGSLNIFENKAGVSSMEKVTADSAFHIIEISTSLIHLLGYARETQLLGKNLLTELIFDAEDRDIIKLYVSRFGVLSWYPVFLRRKNGRKCGCDMQVVPQKKIQKIVGYDFYFKTDINQPSSDLDLPKSDPTPLETLIEEAAEFPLHTEKENDLFVIDETTIPFLAHPDDEEEEESPDQRTSIPDIVLIIDDDPAIIDVNATVLNFVGFKTYSTKTLEQGLQLIHDLGKQIKAIILDYSLLEMIGEPNIEKIMQLSPQSALILSSGYSSEAFQELLKNSNAVWLQKPYSSEQLVELVSRQIKTMAKKF